MRKAAKVSGIEYYSYLRSLDSLERAHVAVVVLDATLGMGELDLRSPPRRRGAAAPRCSRPTRATLRRPTSTRSRGRSPQAAPAAAGYRSLGPHRRGLGSFSTWSPSSRARYTAHIPTGAPTGRSPPSPSSARCRAREAQLKTYFIAQYQTTPPRFAVDVNDRDLVTRDFGYFLENRLRERFGLAGVPLIIDFKER